MRLFDNWVASRDASLPEKAHTWSAWAFVAAGVVVITAAMALVVDPFPVVESLLWALPIFAVGVPLVRLVRTAKPQTVWGLDLLQTFAMVHWFGWIANEARPVPEAWVAAVGLLLFVTCFHAYQYGVTFRYPFGLLAVGPSAVLGYGFELSVLLAVPLFWMILGALSQSNEAMARQTRAQAEVFRVSELERKTAAMRRQVNTFSCERRDMEGMVRRLQGNIELLRMDGDLDLAGIATVSETLAKILAGSELTPAEQREARPVGVDVWGCVADVIYDMRKAHQRVYFNIEDTSDQIEMASFYGGDAALRRMLTNIVENAIECQGSNGYVRIEMASTEELIRIAVQDDGPGFPQSLLDDGPRQFQTTKPHGRGIGLWMAAAMVRLSLGKMELTNWGAGARVEIELERHDRNL